MTERYLFRYRPRGCVHQRRRVIEGADFWAYLKQLAAEHPGVTVIQMQEVDWAVTEADLEERESTP